MDNITIKQRIAQRSGERAVLEGIWKLVEQFISPFRTMFFQEKNMETAVDWRLRELYDSTAIFANQNLAASLDGSLTNSAVQWFHYVFKEPEAKRYIEVLQWLEEVNRITYTYLMSSNFSLEVNELYLDLTSYGVGALAQQEKLRGDETFEKFVFGSIPLDEWYFDQDADGNVCNFYRVLYWTAEQILDKFGPGDIPREIHDEAMSGNQSTKRHKVIYCVFKRRGPDYENADTFSVLTPDARPFGEKYFLNSSCEDLGDEGGHYEMPVYVPRWRKASGSIWGWSPSMTAIYDVLSLNQLVELIFAAGEKVIDPPIMTTKRGVMGQIDLSAAGVTVVQDMKSMAPFESRARFDVSGLTKADLKMAIQQAYFMDQLQLKESPAMTATEVHARIQLMQRLLGPTYGRLQSDLLGNMLTRTFKMLYRNRILPPPPDVAVQNGWILDVDYLGPLAKSQRFDDAAAIERTVNTATIMSERSPGVLDNINYDNAIKEYGDVVGVPAKIWNSEATVRLIREQRAQQQQQERELAMAQQGGEAMKSVGEGMQVMQGGAA